MTDAAMPPPKGFVGRLLADVKNYAQTVVFVAGALGAVVVLFRDQIRLDAIDFAHPIVLAIVGGVAIMVVFVGVGVWRDRRRERRLVRIGAGDVVERASRFCLAPRSAADRDAFTRGDRAHETVVSRIVDAEDHSLFFLTGASGVGKTSLLAAWVIPALEKRDPPFVVVEMRGYADPLGFLMVALRKQGTVWERPPRYDDARQALEGAARKAAPSRLLIVIDQFEEFIILNDEAAQAPARAFLADLAARPIRGAQVLLSLRSDKDYVVALQDLEVPGMTMHETWYEVGGFEALEARAFLSGGGLDLSDSLLEEALDEARRIEGRDAARIRPIVLNLIGLALARQAGQIATRGGLASRYVRENLRAPDLAEEAPRLLARMITDAGTKRPMAVTALANAVGMSSGVVRGVLHRLSGEGLVRRLDKENETWEVTHDFVAQIIGQALGRLRVPWWRAVSRQLGPVALALWLAAVLGAWPIYQTVVLPNQIARSGVGIKWVSDGWHVEIVGDPTPDTETLLVSRVLPLVQRLSHVTSLEVRGNDALETLTLPDLPTLASLEVSGNSALETLTLPDLPALASLEVNGNDALETLTLPDLPALASLEVNGNDSLATLTLPDLPTLASLEVGWNSALETLTLPDLPTLASLEVNGNDALEALTLPDLPTLASLEVSWNDALEALTPPDPPTLASLTVNGNDALETLTLPDLPALASLTVRGNSALEALTLPDLPTLASLTVSMNRALETLTLPDLPAPTELVILDNPALRSLRLQDLSATTELVLRGSPDLGGAEVQAILQSLAPVLAKHGLAPETAAALCIDRSPSICFHRGCNLQGVTCQSR